MVTVLSSIAIIWRLEIAIRWVYLPRYADLEPDQGLFHGYTEGTFHHGFDLDLMRAMLGQAGFTEIGFRTAAQIVRFVPEGLAPFKIFLAAARKVS